jgi:phospholipid/cholesterol/gamma-HCH transport system substrate-binding protein
MLVTYPFPQAATGAVQGDFTNLRITADLDLRTILTNLNGGKNPGLPSLPPVPNPTGPLPTVTVPSVPLPSISLPVPLPTSTTAVPLPSNTCVAGICIGAPAGATSGAYDTNLARLMLGGLT